MTSPLSIATDELRPEAVAPLRDGSRIRVRPVCSSDKELLRRGFERLSEESRYRRFLAPMPELTESMVRYLTEVDHHAHEALVALDDRTGEGVGVARFVRDRTRRTVAEAAVTVVDDWQGRGVATLLLDALAARAREEGITSFTALLLATNDEALELFAGLGGPVRVVDRTAGTVEVEVPVPDAGLSPELRRLLRMSARTSIAYPPREVAIDRSIYIVDDGSRTYRFGRRNPDWRKLNAADNERNKRSIDGYVRVFASGRTKTFHAKAA